jgi:type II restriction/modification system DNA methylase subunit YeeA
MPLSWNEIRDRATAFARDWKHAESEDAEAKSFWDGFFDVFGVPRRRVASFERRVKKLDGKDGYIDLLWKGTLLVEHKSRGRDLDAAHKQALGYFEGLRDRDLPRYVLVSDFARFRLFDLELDTQVEFRLSELPRRIKHFAFIAGYTPQTLREQDPVNIKAAETLGRLHDALKASGYTGHPLEVLLVRLLFCLFADDTGIFELQSFREFVEQRTSEDGADLGPRLAELFQVFNTEGARRQKTLDPQLAAFPYVNGQVFAEPLPIAQFDAAMRQTLLDCCALNWAAISPAIFGAMFQSVMDARARRNLGAHYTSEANILKLIKPLFLDALWAEFERVKGNRARLLEFHQRLRRLNFLDPACGCGNFLVITYRELRLLELEVLRASASLKDSQSGKLFDVNLHQQVSLNVDQFHGIEIEEFPAQIAQVALWLTDHQMNQKVAEEFGMYFARIPLVTTPHIHCGNALTTDWNTVLPAERCSYVLGNPPFVGKQHQSAAQKADLETVARGIAGAGVLDFVAGWYVRAAAYIKGTAVRCALVATNSITQGEQVAVLWGWLLAQGVRIHFAHRTFQWSNEARGVAAVHCVIIGFGVEEPAQRIIFEYDNPAGEPQAVSAANINPYLVDAPNVVLPNRRGPI